MEHLLRNPALALLCLILSLASVGSERASADVGTVVRVSGEVIEYRGPLTQDANERVFAMFDAAQPKPRILAIDSKGGSAEAGMQLGAWIFAKTLDVRVTDMCLSSCASYVFPAGRTKLLAPTATLLWHGGATQPICDDEIERLLDEVLIDMSERDRGELLRHSSRAQLIAALKDSLEFLIARERLFFAMLGVDSRIATLGQLYQRELLQAGDSYIGWDYSLEDLTKLGVHDVVVSDDQAWTPAREIDGAKIYRLHLDQLTSFSPEIDNEDSGGD